MRQRRIRIAVTGECMVELLPVRSEGGEALFRQGFSGDTLNTAVYLSRLGGLETSYLSAVGNDPLSESMLDFWQGEGGDCSLVRRIPGASPGLYMIRNDRHGERSFFYWRSSSAARFCYSGSGAQALLDRLETFDCIYLSGISLAVFQEDGRNRLLERLESLAGNISVCFDANFRPRLWGANRAEAVAAAMPWYRRMLPITSMLFLSAEEIDAFGAEGEMHSPRSGMLGLVSHMKPGAEAVMKDGPRPCLIWDGTCLLQSMPCKGKNVVDATAAGDSFAAAYLHARLQGLSPERAARRGHRLAAAVIEVPGAIIPADRMPHMEDADDADE